MMIGYRSEVALLVFPSTAKFGDPNIRLVRTVWCCTLNMWRQSQRIGGTTYEKRGKGPK